MGIAEQIVTRGLGGIILFTQARNAHAWGKMRADTYAQSGDADALARTYINTRMTQMPEAGSEMMKDYAFRKELDSNMRHFSNSVRGYWGGLARMAAYNVVPITLGLVACVTPPKWKIARIAAAGLAVVFTAMNWTKERHGVGYHAPLNSKFVDPNF